MADQWNDLSTGDKLNALYEDAKARAAQLQSLQERAAAQVLPMVDQIGDLTARVAALEAASRKG